MGFDPGVIELADDLASARSSESRLCCWRVQPLNKTNSHSHSGTDEIPQMSNRVGEKGTCREVSVSPNVPPPYHHRSVICVTDRSAPSAVK